MKMELYPPFLGYIKYKRFLCIGNQQSSAKDHQNPANMKIEETIGQILKEKNLTLSTAESCTGGNIAARITSVPGSSEYYKGSVIAYDNEVKISLLKVSPDTLEEYGAVSRETVVEMVKGAMRTLKTTCAVATSGIAGPGGGTPTKPVGTIWIAAANGNELITLKLEEDRGRTINIENTVNEALNLLLKLLK
jgi:PncC family amidohydrolase